MAKMEAISAPTTANGQSRIARPANGTHIVSKKGPSRPLRSCKCFLNMASNEITGISTMKPRTPTMRAPGIYSNLQNEVYQKIL